MENFILFFETMPSWYKLAWIFICLAFCWLLESGAPFAVFAYRKWRHTGINLVFLSTSLLINVLFGLATAGLLLFLRERGIGLFYYVQLPMWLVFPLSILLLDLIAQWWAHYLLHHVKWMWKLHMVHHSDTKVDASTGTRHHPGDYLVREVFSLVTVLVFGIPVGIYLFYRILTVFFTYLTHANFRLPLWLDQALSWVFVTPDMHKFHHHFERPWTDTNYGNIFSIWDRLFGTMVYDDPTKIRYGLDVLDDATDESVAYQMQLPFDKGVKTDY